MSKIQSIEFTEHLNFPRYTRFKGEQIKIRSEVLTHKGFIHGGGFVTSHQFKIVNKVKSMTV